MKGPCACGSEMPEVSLYNVREHVCQNCGREYELVGTSVVTTVPPGCERVERIETFLRSAFPAPQDTTSYLFEKEAACAITSSATTTSPAKSAAAAAPSSAPAKRAARKTSATPTTAREKP